MTKPVIVTRQNKGAPLTRAELDANFQNINDAVISVTGDTGTITNSLNGAFQISGGVATTSKVINEALIIDLDNTAVTPGSYTAADITVDAQGRITSAANGTAINNMSIGATTKSTGAFTTLTADTLTIDEVRDTVFALTYAATLTPSASNGSVQTVTLTGNLTLSAFTSPVSGQSITLILTQDATGSRTLTSTMKFAGGVKTLTTTANAIDILTISYIGTTYYASLSKGFA